MIGLGCITGIRACVAAFVLTAVLASSTPMPAGYAGPIGPRLR